MKNYIVKVKYGSSPGVSTSGVVGRYRYPSEANNSARLVAKLTGGETWVVYEGRIIRSYRRGTLTVYPGHLPKEVFGFIATIIDITESPEGTMFRPSCSNNLPLSRLEIFEESGEIWVRFCYCQSWEKNYNVLVKSMSWILNSDIRMYNAIENIISFCLKRCSASEIQMITISDIDRLYRTYLNYSSYFRSVDFSYTYDDRNKCVYCNIGRCE